MPVSGRSAGPQEVAGQSAHPTAWLSRGQVLGRRLAVDAGQQQAAELGDDVSSGGGPAPAATCTRQERVCRGAQPRRVGRAAHALEHEVREQERDVEGRVAPVRDLEVEREHAVGVGEQVLRRPVAEHQAAARASRRSTSASITRGEVRVRGGRGAVVGIDPALHQRRQVGEVARPPGVAGRPAWMRPSSAPARSPPAGRRAPRAARPSSSRRRPAHGT